MKCLCTTCALTCTRDAAPLPRSLSPSKPRWRHKSCSLRDPSCLSRCISLLTRLSRKPLILLRRQHLPEFFHPCMEGSRSGYHFACVCLTHAMHTRPAGIVNLSLYPSISISISISWIPAHLRWRPAGMGRGHFALALALCTVGPNFTLSLRVPLATPSTSLPSFSRRAHASLECGPRQMPRTGATLRMQLQPKSNREQGEDGVGGGVGGVGAAQASGKREARVGMKEGVGNLPFGAEIYSFITEPIGECQITSSALCPLPALLDWREPPHVSLSVLCPLSSLSSPLSLLTLSLSVFLPPSLSFSLLSPSFLSLTPCFLLYLSHPFSLSSSSLPLPLYLSLPLPVKTCAIHSPIPHFLRI